MTNLMNKLRVKSRVEVVLAVQTRPGLQETGTVEPLDKFD